MIGSPSMPHLVGAADDRRARGAPDDRQVHQRRDIGDDEDDRRRERERQRQIARAGRLLGEHASRTARSAPCRPAEAAECAAAGRNRGRQPTTSTSDHPKSCSESRNVGHGHAARRILTEMPAAGKSAWPGRRRRSAGQSVKPCGSRAEALNCSRCAVEQMHTTSASRPNSSSTWRHAPQGVTGASVGV